jgi:UDP-2,3-diacylglucosamine pyrophosphatase LpxH
MPYLLTAGKITKSKQPLPMYILARLNLQGQAISASNALLDAKLTVNNKEALAKGASSLGRKLKAAVTFPGGNHDLWMRGYFEEELGIKVYHQPEVFRWNQHTFFIGHGDGLGPGDYGYKRLKKIFRNPICQWLFAKLHPDWGIGLANYFSRTSREATGSSEQHFLGADKEWLIQYCYRKLQQQPIDYFLFGHRHFPIDFTLNEKSRYVNVGDWIQHFSYAVYDGDTLQLITRPASA